MRKKKSREQNWNYFLFPKCAEWPWLLCQKCLNNSVLTRRLKSKQHEEISKAKQSPLSHAYTITVQKMSDDSPFVQAGWRAKALTQPLIAHLLVYTDQGWWPDKQLISLEIGPNWGEPVICDRGRAGWTLMGTWFQIKASHQCAEQRLAGVAGFPGWCWAHLVLQPFHPRQHARSSGSSEILRSKNHPENAITKLRCKASAGLRGLPVSLSALSGFTWHHMPCWVTAYPWRVLPVSLARPRATWGWEPEGPGSLRRMLYTWRGISHRMVANGC